MTDPAASTNWSSYDRRFRLPWELGSGFVLLAVCIGDYFASPNFLIITNFLVLLADISGRVLSRRWGSLRLTFS